MKKLLFIAAFGISAVAVKAQDGGRSISFGIKAGANFSNLKFKSEGEDDEMERKTGIHAGAFVNIPVGLMFSVNPELVYSQEGAKDEDEGFEVKINLDYINLPVLLQYNNESGFFAETGPQIGFLMSAKTKIEFEGDEEEEDVKEEFEKTNLSWAIGAGYRHASGIGFNTRYNLGLSNIAKNGDEGETLKTNTIQVTISKTF